MDFDTFKTTVNKTVAEICTLCGLETYNQEKQNEMFKAQMRSIARFIYEGYPFLTDTEIINAFYYNLQGKFGDIIKIYGADKKITVEFIGQVLSGYVKYKQNYININPSLIDIIHPKKLPTPSTQIEMTENEEREMVEIEFQRYRQQADWNCQLVMPFIYQRLEMDDAFRADTWKKRKEQAELMLKRQKQKEKLIPTSREIIRDVDADGNSFSLILKNHDTVKQIENELHQLRNGVSAVPELLAKQICVKNYFAWMVKQGKTRIYSAGDNNNNN